MNKQKKIDTLFTARRMKLVVVGALLVLCVVLGSSIGLIAADPINEAKGDGCVRGSDEEAAAAAAETAEPLKRGFKWKHSQVQVNTRHFQVHGEATVSVEVEATQVTISSNHPSGATFSGSITVSAVPEVQQIVAENPISFVDEVLGDFVIAIADYDEVVQLALHTVLNGGAGIVPGVPHNTAFTLCDHQNGCQAHNAHGNPYNNGNVLVVIGHGSAHSLGGQDSWNGFYRASQLNLMGNLWVPDRIYLVACSTAQEGHLRLDGNIAQQCRAAYPGRGTTIWASSTAVSARNFQDNWARI